MTGFDTNVLIYACDKSDLARRTKAFNLVSATTDGILLWQVACEFIAASRKLMVQGFTPTDAWARLSEFLDVFPLVLPGPSVLERARGLHLDQGWSFWDAMVVSAAKEAGATRLYSEDLPGGSVEGLEIINPFGPSA